MKVTQKKVRTFHCMVTSDEDFFSYFRKNITILREYFIILSGNISEAIEIYLKKEQICFQNINGCQDKIFNINREQLLKNELTSQHNADILAEFKEKKVKIYDRTIRSGEEIINSGDIIINGRVNSGAIIRGSSSVIIYNTIDGVVECSGEYMILRDVDHGVVYFNTEPLNIGLSKVLKLIYLRSGNLIVKELK